MKNIKIKAKKSKQVDKNGVPVKIEVFVYYTIDENGYITIDTESMNEEYEQVLNELISRF